MTKHELALEATRGYYIHWNLWRDKPQPYKGVALACKCRGIVAYDRILTDNPRKFTTPRWLRDFNGI